VGVLLTAILLAIILYEPPPEELRWCCDPCMELSREDEGGGRWKVVIAGGAEAQDLDRFEARVLRNGSTIASMDPVSTNATGVFTFTDLNGDGRLTAGDSFVVQCDLGTYELYILWRESGCAKGGTDWEV
jgi:hypothetical protein